MVASVGKEHLSEAVVQPSPATPVLPAASSRCASQSTHGTQDTRLKYETGPLTFPSPIKLLAQAFQLLIAFPDPTPSHLLCAFPFLTS